MHGRCLSFRVSPEAFRDDKKFCLFRRDIRHFDMRRNVPIEKSLLGWISHTRIARFEMTNELVQLVLRLSGRPAGGR